MSHFIKTSCCLILCLLSFFNVNIYAQTADTTLAREYQQRGRQFARLAQYDSALLYIDKAHEIFKAAGRKSVYLYLQVYKAELINASGETEQALSLLQETLQSCEKELPEAAYPTTEVHNILSVIYYTLGDREKCEFHVQKALEIERKKEKPTKQLVTFLVNKANFDFRFGIFKATIPIYEEALQLYKDLELQDPGLLTKIYGNLGNVYERLGEQKRAEGILLKALEIKEKNLPAGHPSIAISLINIANTQQGMGDLEKAMDTQERARKMMLVYPKAQQRNLAFVSANLAMNYGKIQQYEKAESMAKEAIGIAESLYQPGHPMITQITMRLAHIFGYRDRTKEFELYQGLIDKIDEKNTPFIKVRILENIGTNLYQRGQYPEALEYLDQAETLLFKDKKGLEAGREGLAEIDDKEQLFWILWGKAYTYKGLAEEEKGRQENLQKAQQYYQHVIEMLNLSYEDLRYEESRKAFLSGYIREVFEEAIWVESELYKLDPKAASLEHTFSLAENRKSTYLLESIRNADPKRFSGIPQSILETEKQLLADLEKSGANLQALKAANSLKRNELVAKQIRLSGSYDSLVSLIESQYPDYYQIKYQQESINLEALQRSLKEGSLLLEYYEGKEYLFLLATDNERFDFFQLEKNKAQDSILTEFLFSTANKKSVEAAGASEAAKETYASQAHTLYAYLLEAAMKGKNYQELIIIPDGKLSYLSFDLLLEEKLEDPANKNWRDFPYLFQKYRIQYAYSASVRDLRGRVKNRANELFAGFAPQYGSELLADSRDLQSRYQERVVGELRFSQEEVAEIAGYYGGDTFLAERAGEALFKSSAQNFQVLHLAMHAFVNDEEAMYSGLLFAPPGENDSTEDGFLHAFEIYNLDLNAELVVLSACNTGQGQFQQGEGVVSLARAFAYAGCPNIMMSLWQADDAASRTLMQAYHKHLAEGKGKVEALQLARTAYLENSDLTHPYYWGAFVLIGDDEPLSKRNPTWIYFLLAGVLLAGIFYFFRKRSTV